MAERKFKVIRVTIEEDYIVEMHDDKKSMINGWSLKRVVLDWFKDHSTSYHATRDSHLIGGTRKYIKHEIVTLEDINRG